MTALLSVSGLRAAYGASPALFGIDLTVNTGEVVALMGRNGMGKSTTVKCICRLMRAEGDIIFAGQDLRRLPAHRAARLGIGLVPEGRRCFADLTVLENLTAAARTGPWDASTVGKLFPRLSERQGQIARSLSGGEQQMLAIGRALMTNPRLLILDEATEGLAPLIRQEIWTSIKRLKRESGLAILIIDKSLRELRAVSDRAGVLNRGQSVWEGKIDGLSPDLAQRYLGV